MSHKGISFSLTFRTFCDFGDMIESSVSHVSAFLEGLEAAFLKGLEACVKVESCNQTFLVALSPFVHIKKEY